jgi:pyruvate formate lyase activating enzyme
LSNDAVATVRTTPSQVARDAPISGVEQSPEEAVEKALATGCRSIAYTYTEPTIFFDYA